MHTIAIKTHQRQELIDITEKVSEFIEQAEVKTGICIIYCPHTTAGLTINENADPSVKKDLIDYLAKLIPQKDDFSHSEGNSDAHIKTSLIGNSLSLIIENSEITLGRWQGIYFCEFDGPRQREVFIRILTNS